MQMGLSLSELSNLGGVMRGGEMPDKDTTTYFASNPYVYFFSQNGKQILMKEDIDQNMHPRIRLYDPQKGKAVDVKVK